MVILPDTKVIQLAMETNDHIYFPNLLTPTYLPGKPVHNSLNILTILSERVYATCGIC